MCFVWRASQPYVLITQAASRDLLTCRSQICWGPLSFLVAYMVTTDSPLRHPLQIIVSLGQLYGDVLYYATSMFDHYIFDIAYCRPEPYYFWCYYFLMNFFWIVIPLGSCPGPVSQWKTL